MPETADGVPVTPRRRTAGHGGEYTGKNAPGVSFPILPRPLKNKRKRWRAQVETGDPSGARGKDPTKSFWHGGDRDEATALASREIARQEAEDAIVEAWY